MQKILFVASLLLTAHGCVDDASLKDKDSQAIEGSSKLTASNSAGNLVASAVKDYYEVDVAFIPSVILKDSASFQLQAGASVSEENKAQLFGLYDETKDSIRTGTMKGSDIREFILKRTSKYMDMDLQVAGLQFDLKLRGGWPDAFVVTRDQGIPLEDDRLYRIAISNYFYRSPFPGYYYGDNMNFSFNLEFNGFGSIKRALEVFLDKNPNLAPLNEARGFVENRVVGELGLMSIAQIQGVAHLSPYLGYAVTTRGVVTAVGVPTSADSRDWSKIPGRELPTEIIIQDPLGDGDERSSEALSVFLPGTVTDYKVGQLLEVRGVVHEIRSGGGFSGTSLRMVESISVLAENQALPEPVVLGTGGRILKSKLPSTFVGNLNARSELNVNEGIDFWESLEGMRVSLKSPRVTGARGGLKDFNAAKQGRASYVEISLVPEGMDAPEDRTSSNGNFYDPYEQDFNIETVKMVDGPLSPAIDPTKLIVENGDNFASDLVGILSFNRNTFGDGRFVFYLTGPLESPRKKETALEDRPKTRFESTPDHLVFAAWNVENLGGTDTERLKETAGVISKHLRCPDIMSMPEIQDNNAENINGGSAADLTLANIIKGLSCPGSDYKALNIDPVPFRDGGEFGGNIRVAMIYNANRVSFSPKGNPTATSDTFVEANGSLNQNPGRIDPRNPALEGSRKPLVAEFVFKGQKVFVVGNHFNSMLGEGSPLGAMQPYRFRTEKSRTAIAGVVRNFVEELRSRDTNAHLIVAGDFNSYHQSNSMRTLAGSFLTNLMTAEGLCPRERWFTTNYDGNSGAIDFIFASRPLMDKQPEFEILNINSPFMVRLSDHDPIMARFKF